MAHVNEAPDVDSILEHARYRICGGNLEWAPVDGGSINSVWRGRSSGRREVILRIGPSREIVARGSSWMRFDGLAGEQIVLDRLRSTVHTLPVPIAAGFRGNTLPWVAQEIVPGVAFADVMDDMDEESRAATWLQIGELIRQVWDLPAPWFGTPTGDQRFADWSSMVLADVEGLLDDAWKFDLPVEPFQELYRMVTSSVDVLDQVGRPHLVHSDLDPRHVFVIEKANGWQISGIIDWEYARYADPMSESVVVEMLSRPEDDSDRKALLEGLGVEKMSQAMEIRQSMYHAVSIAWEITDAARSDDQVRRDNREAAFQRWADNRRAN